MVESRLASAASGTALTTTLALTPVQAAGRLVGRGTLELTGRNYSTAVLSASRRSPN